MMTRASKADREQDILDMLALGQITKDRAAVLLTDLYRDYYQAMGIVRMAMEAEVPAKN